MPFAPHILALLETALAEIFSYHNELDTFLQRSGISTATIFAARKKAEERNSVSGRFDKAPKRIVVQEILRNLGDGNKASDQHIAALITALSKGTFPNATSSAINAIKNLKKNQEEDKAEVEKHRIEEVRKKRETEAAREALIASDAAKRQSFLDDFVSLSSIDNSQKRGYELERFLNEFFEFEGLSPRGSFRVENEQIDGSFLWESRTYLVEAKWVKDKVGGAEFGAFDYKLAGRTVDTRGLFLSINGYSEQAITSLNGKGSLRFICIDGSHLFRSLQPGNDFKKLMTVLRRHSDETGESYLPVSSEQFLKRYSNSHK